MQKLIIIILLFGINQFVWQKSKIFKPELNIVPELTGKINVKALSFGDEQFYYRVLGLQIQNAGDSFGRFSALQDYDYKKLSQWFYLLDTLDDVSNYVPSIAGHYYSQTTNIKDVRYIVDYLVDHANKDFAHRWNWMFHAAFLADQTLKDRQLAIKISENLLNLPADAPVWAKYFHSILIAKSGETEKAYKIVRMLTENIDEISAEEQRYVKFFMEHHLNMSQEVKQDE